MLFIIPVCLFSGFLYLLRWALQPCSDMVVKQGRKGLLEGWFCTISEVLSTHSTTSIAWEHHVQQLHIQRSFNRLILDR